MLRCKDSVTVSQISMQFYTALDNIRKRYCTMVGKWTNKSNRITRSSADDSGCFLSTIFIISSAASFVSGPDPSLHSTLLCGGQRA